MWLDSAAAAVADSWVFAGFAEDAEHQRRREMPKNTGVIEIKREWCKSCGICVDACSLEVLEMRGEYPEVVGMCEVLCPDFAITVEKVKETAGKVKQTAEKVKETVAK
jgi:2-oxoglutarate ferredoxin oxidoreductase subunit delta